MDNISPKGFRGCSAVEKKTANTALHMGIPQVENSNNKSLEAHTLLDAATVTKLAKFSTPSLWRSSSSLAKGLDPKLEGEMRRTPLDIAAETSGRFTRFVTPLVVLLLWEAGP